MVITRSTKLKKEKVGNSEDRLSSLSDAILTHILSLLKTKEVVRTGVLSTRWKVLWASVPTLDLDMLDFLLEADGLISDYTDRDREIRARYLNFVDRVLMDHSIPFLEKVVLRYTCYDSTSYDLSHMESWICASVEKNVRELDLGSNWGVGESLGELPQCLYSCNSFVVLKLDLNMVLNYPKSFNGFPNLKVLQLKGITFKDDNSAQYLFSSCPVLEDLVMDRKNPDGLEMLNITSHSLKNLVVESLQDSVQKMVIDAPVLEYICITDIGTIDYAVRDLPSVIKAKLDIIHDHSRNYVTPLFKLLRGICSVKSLYLSRCSLTALSAAISYNLPMFYSLTSLQFFDDDSDDPCSWKLFIEFLKSSPRLEVLVFKYFEFRGDVSWDKNAVPKCLQSHLRTITISDYSERELEKVEYLLMHATVLENATIDLRNVYGKIESIEMGSRRCQLTLL